MKLCLSVCLHCIPCIAQRQIRATTYRMQCMSIISFRNRCAKKVQALEMRFGTVSTISIHLSSIGIRIRNWMDIAGSLAICSLLIRLPAYLPSTLGTKDHLNLGSFQQQVPSLQWRVKVAIEVARSGWG